MNFPKITVITPSYNQGQFLEDTIRSVIEQNYPNLEYLVFDGGSTDNSVEILKKYDNYVSFWVSERDNGQTDAINKGLKKAKGEIVTWLNSDDFYYSGALHLIADMYNKYPEAGLYIGNGTVVDKNGIRIRKYSKDILFDFDILLKGSNYILQPSTFINYKAIKQLGCLDESLFYTMDLEYWLRISKTFDVVTVNEELSAYRWYDEIKTKTGGIRRWVEQWNIMRRYSNTQITPGLLVEFFNVIQEPDVMKDLGFNIEDYAKENWQKFYIIMQKYLCTNDCIPVKSKGKIFNKEKLETKEKNPVKNEKINFPNLVRSKGSSLKIDIVLPEGHSWFVREGYAESLKRFNVFGKSFYVSDKKNNNDLFNYLKNPNADMIFLMNTEWHAQYLHKTYEWQKRWNENKLIKVLFSFECMNNPTIKGNNIWWEDNITAIDNAMKSVNSVVYAHEIDAELFSEYNVPILWQPFAIDENLFPIPKLYLLRKQKAFFKGKTTPFYYEKTYSKRRVIAQQLKQSHLCEIVEDYDWQSNRQFIEEMNEFQITLGLPSLSPTMVVRPFEAMGSGCVFFQNKVLGNKTNLLFEDNKNLLMYDENNIPQLIEKVKFVIDNPEYGKQIAEAGYQEVMEKHTINNRVLEFLNWVEYDKQYIKTSSKKQEIKQYFLPKKNKIAVDGVIFQLQKSRPYGISRVWISLLSEISKTELANDIVLLDRGETAPRIPGIKSVIIKEYDYIKFESDSLYLQDVCNENNVNLFISTYYTYPENTHNLLMLHDMIPEILGLDLTKPEWRAKLKALNKANAYLSVSENTIADFRKLYPEFDNKKSFLVSNAVAEDFNPRNSVEIKNFNSKYNIRKPYFILVGNRLEYKNAILFFKAFSKLDNKKEFEIFCTGGKREMESIFKPYLEGIDFQIQFLSNEELSIAYSGAVALVYPSKYEGFGLPILEAMKSGCPVITCRNSSIPEVAGDAVIFVDEDNVNEMVQALSEINKPQIKKPLIEKGYTQSAKFSWVQSANKFQSAIVEISEDMNGRELNPSDPLDTFERVEYSLKSNIKLKRFNTNINKLKQLFLDNKIHKNSEFVSAEKVLEEIDEEVLKILNQLSEINSEDGLIFYLLGTYYYLKNNKTIAFNLFLSAIKKKFLHWRVFYLAAKSAFDIEKLDEAKIMLKKTLEQNPVFPEAEELLKKIKKIKNEEFEVSAIVSTYNSEQYIEGCLKDLIEQTLYKKGELEIIVVNTGSQQNEEAIVRKYQSKYKYIKYIKTDNRQPIYTAWNIAIKYCRSKYITNANTDDRNRKDAFELKSSFLENNSEIDVVYADDFKTTIPNESFSTSSKTESQTWSDYDDDLLLFGCYIGPHPMWRKSLHKKFGYFDESLKVVADYEFWLRISRQAGFKHLNEFLGLYYYSENSVEHRDKNITNAEKLSVQNKYLCKYIISISEIDRLKTEINSLNKFKSYDGYVSFALEMLNKRKLGLELEKQIITFAKKIVQNVLEKDIDELIEKVKKGRYIIDKEIYLPILLLIKASYYLNKKEIDKLSPVLQEIITYEPGNKFAIEQLNKIEDYEIICNLINCNHKDIDTVFKKRFIESLRFYFTGNFGDAEELLCQMENKIDELPNETLDIKYEFFRVKADCLMKTSSFENAKIYFEKALKIKPDSSEVCEGLAEIFFLYEAYEQSKTMCEWAVRNDPKNQQAIELLEKNNIILGLSKDHNTLINKIESNILEEK